MAVQMNVTTRNARLDSIESTNGTSCALEIRSGSQPADCSQASSGTLLVTINLPTDWMAAASGGQKAKAGTWQDASADGAGTAGHFRVYNSQATKDGTTCFLQGSVGQGTGDLQLDNVSIASGQQVTITGFTLTDGNS
jgi:hypothetical protein